MPRAGRSRPAGKQLPQVHPVHELHQEIEKPVRLAELEQCDDARMHQPGQRLGFPGEAFGKGGVIPAARGQDFQGDHPVELLLPRLIDRAHAAVANQFENIELREVPGDFLERGRLRGGGRRRAMRPAVSPVISVCVPTFNASRQRGQRP